MELTLCQVHNPASPKQGEGVADRTYREAISSLRDSRRIFQVAGWRVREICARRLDNGSVNVYTRPSSKRISRITTTSPRPPLG